MIGLDRIAPENCDMTCPHSRDKCGGNLAIHVSFTGVRIVNKHYQAQEREKSISFLSNVG